ncbi:MAG: laminarinase [Bacteroidetes bacterium]|nr:MAG: laminarinase [Bacteroidota bacterium]
MKPGEDRNQTEEILKECKRDNGWFYRLFVSFYPTSGFHFNSKKIVMKTFLFFFSVLNIMLGQSVYGQEKYHLVWSDEFNQAGAPDQASWGYDVGDHGWGNNEMQNYTRSTENAFVRDGKLFIRAIKNNDKWTSARLITKNKVDFLYGKMEIRAKLPEGKGTWPAVWLLPTDWEYGGWPSSGEIDIMEHVGYDPGVVHATVHTESYNHVIGTQVGTSIAVPDFAGAFHNYTVVWDADSVDIYFDDNKYFSFSNDKTGNFATWPFDKRFHLILNIAIGGNWGGAQGIDPDLTEAVMEIEYVRLYSADKKR